MPTGQRSGYISGFGCRCRLEMSPISDMLVRGNWQRGPGVRPCSNVKFQVQVKFTLSAPVGSMGGGSEVGHISEDADLAMTVLT